MKRRRKRPACHEAEDQYGDTGASQDRDEAIGSTRGSLRGGGSAGRHVRKEDVVYERHVPKFLQKHMHHLLPPDRQSVHQTDDAARDRDEEEQEAMNRALEEDPSLAKELNPEIINKAKAAKEKEWGNEAYARGNHTTAIRHFTNCIKLDPLNEVYYSNRSAVYASVKEYENAVRDAESVIRMRPDWVKGWARLAVAHFGLEQYSHAVDAYKQALKIEPDDNTLVSGRNQAEEQERRQIQANKHTFTRSRKKPKPTIVPSGSKNTKVHLDYEDDDD